MGLGVLGNIGLTMLTNAGAEESYVVMGACAECSFGSMSDRLILPLSHGVFIKGKAQLNIMDFKPFLNILPFGMCSSLLNPAVAAATAAKNGVLQKMPCTPVVVTPWMSGKTDKLVENFPALLNKSTNMCLFAGYISINDDGQK